MYKYLDGYLVVRDSYFESKIICDPKQIYRINNGATTHDLLVL